MERPARGALGAAGLVVLLSLLAGCDPGHAFEDVRVQVRTDGTALVVADALDDALTAGSVAADEAAFSASIAQRLGIGTVEGEPAVYSDEFETNAVGVKLIAVPRDRVVIHLDDIVAAMQVIGVRTDAGTFVSVCVADASGGVSGVGVESVLHSSCAVAEGPLSEIPAGSTVKVRRGSRRWLASWPYLVALFALLGFAIFGIIGSLRRNAIAEDRGVGTALIGMVGLVVLAAVARAQFLTDTPWFTCGQNLHYGWATRPGFARLSLFSAIAVGVSLLIARLSMRYLPRRRVPAGADEHSD